jgi:pimeloyl-ACP methyl ester carboxylesterase
VYVVRSADSTFSAELLARFDIVGFDPRGVGLSRATKCFSNEEQQQAYAGAKARPTAAGFGTTVGTAARFDQA